MEDKRKEVEEKFKVAVATAQQLLKEIGEMRAIDIPQINPETEVEAANEIVKLARELDERTAYLLRGLLIPYGGTLFL